MKIITSEKQKEIDRVILRKLKFMGRIQAEKYGDGKEIDYNKINNDAENILISDNVVCGF